MEKELDMAETVMTEPLKIRSGRSRFFPRKKRGSSEGGARRETSLREESLRKEISGWSSRLRNAILAAAYSSWI